MGCPVECPGEQCLAQQPGSEHASLVAWSDRVLGRTAKEERITAASRQLMAEVNAFRAGQENTKAAYLAAEEAAKAVDAEIASAPES